ncbi:MAG: PQQ-binding-like beta-propeller repeat protein [Armatimonadetes bacterium]|nr:PQQ-binding-like beta-propeller repeat protein [Armatimonadota bacterium]
MNVSPIHPSDRAPRIDWRSSTERWTDTPPLEFGDTVVVGNLLHKVHGLDAGTGQKRWTVDVGDKLTDFEKAGGSTLLASSVGSVGTASPEDKRQAVAIDARNGTVLWQHDVQPWGPSRLVAPDGGVFLVRPEPARLERVDPQTGEPLWTRELEVNGQTLFAPDGSLIAAVADPEVSAAVVCLDPATGNTRWSYRPGGWVQGLQLSGGKLLLTASKESSDHLFVLDGSTGRPLSRMAAPAGGFRAAPQLGPDGKVYYGVPTQIGVRLEAFDPQTDSVAWSREEAFPTDLGGPLLTFAGSSVYLATQKVDEQWNPHGDVVRSFDTATGAVRWTFEPGDASNLEVRGTPEGSVLVLGTPKGGYGHVAFALDSDSGRPRWRFDPGSHIHDLLPGPDGQVLIHAEEDGYRLHVLDLATGEPRWQFNTGDRLHIAASSDHLRAVDHEGQLFSLRWSPPAEQGSFQGGPPRDPGQSGGASDYHGTYALLDGEFAGAPALWADYNQNGKVDTRDGLLIRDRDADARIGWGELAEPVKRDELTALDRNGDGLVSDTEIAGSGLWLWRDHNGDGRIGAGELSEPGLDGLHPAFDLERSRLELSGSERFSNGHIKSKVPGPAPPIEPPAGEIPPDAVNAFGDLVSSMEGEWRGAGHRERWIGTARPEGLHAYAELPVATELPRYEFELEKGEGIWRLREKRLGGDTLTLPLSDYDVPRGTYLFGYPDRWEGDTLARGGGIEFSAAEGGGFVLGFRGSDGYRRDQHGRLRQVRSGGAYGYTFRRKLETRLPVPEDQAPGGSIDVDGGYVDVDGVRVPVRDPASP